MLLICLRRRNGLHSQNGAINGVRNPTKVQTLALTSTDLTPLGGILSVKFLGRPMIIVNSAAIMTELDKKGAIYSDQPVLEMGSKLVGYSETLVLMHYGALF